jgi:hypothetical protein
MSKKHSNFYRKKNIKITVNFAQKNKRGYFKPVSWQKQVKIEYQNFFGKKTG